MFHKPKKKLITIVTIGVAVLAIVGVAGALNGWFGGGASIPSDTMTRGLVGYWSMDEGTATTTYDLSGNNNHGYFQTAASSPKWTTQGKVNGALQFDGTNDYVNCGNSSSLDTSGVMTLEAWVKGTGAADYRMILSKTQFYYEFRAQITTGNLHFTYDDNHTGDVYEFDSGFNILDNEWHYVVFTRDSAGTAILYADGAEKARTTISFNFDGATEKLYIGYRGKTEQHPWNGSIDEVRIYNRALTAEEIRYHYNRGGPVGYWKFDEGSGSTAYDATDNNNNGTLYGGMATSTAVDSGWNPGKYGTALSFDGTNDYMSATDSSNLDITGDMTISSWIKTTDTDGVIVAKWDATSNQRSYGLAVGLSSEGTKLYLYLSDDGTGNESKRGNISVNDNAWHYATAVYIASADTVTFYVDGKTDRQQTFTSETGALYSSTAQLWIGDEQTGGIGGLFNGLIDDVRIYNYARTPDEIALDYNAGFAAHFGPSSSCEDDPGACMTKGLVGYWSMDEGTATTTYDLSGNNNNGYFQTAAASPKWTTQGKVNGALQFDGVNDYVNAGKNSSLDMGTGDFSAETWIKRAPMVGTEIEAIAGKAEAQYSLQAGQRGWWLLLRRSGGLVYVRFDVRDENDNVYDFGIVKAVDDNAWHHIVGVKTSSNLTIYVDGVSETGNITFNSTIDSAATNQYIGNDQSNSRKFNGLIDEVRIYNRALSPEEIRYHYNRGGPVGYWKFDEGSGSTAYDATDNNNNGTLYGGMATSTAVDSGWKPGKYGTALSFDGTNDYIDVGDKDNLDGMTALTVEAWINPTLTGAHEILHIASKDNSGSDRAWAFGIQNTETPNKSVALRTWNSAGGERTVVTAANTVSESAWQHVVGVLYTDDTMKLYINGTAMAVTYSASNVIDNIRVTAAECHIGNTQMVINRYFNGLIDDVRVYNYARTPDEIALDYNAGFAARFGPQSSCEDDPGACMTKGLVGYWPMDEGTATTTFDLSGNNNHGYFQTTASSPKWTTQGKVNGAMQFDGVNDYVNAGSGANLNIAGAITIEAWVKRMATGAQHFILDRRNTAATSQVNYNLYLRDTGLMEFNYRNSTDTTWHFWRSTGAFTDTAWHHFVLSFTFGNGASIKVYDNGVEIAGSWISGNGNELPIANSFPLTIGSTASGASFFNGLIDDVRIYNRALSVEEVRYHYNRGGPVGYWKFDEGSGSTAYDATDNNNNGTLYGGMATSTAVDSGWKPGKYGTALSFDGTNDKTLMLNSSNLNTPTSALTISSWIKRVGSNALSGDSALVEKGWSDQYGLRVSNTRYLIVKLLESTGTHTLTWTSTAQTANNDWSFVVATFNKPNVTVFVDGIQIDSTTWNYDIATTTQNLGIGATGGVGGLFFNGLIDDVRIYNYARTPAQILQDYNQGRSVHFK